MTKFEYKILKLNPGGISGEVKEETLAKELNHYGDEGWELVSTSVNSLGGGVLATFKRIKI